MNEIKFTYGMSPSQLAKKKTIFSSDLLQGKTALISGGASGIGNATAWLYARLGARVVLCARNKEKLESAVGLMKEHGLNAQYKQVDIRDPDRVANLMDELFSDGGLDVLLNNAGGQFPQESIDFSPNGWKAVIDNNLNGTWFMMQAAAQRWRESKRPGIIINMVVVVDDSMHGVAHSCAARAGVIKASEKVSVEWAPYNIRVNCVAPGVIDSAGMKVYSEQARQKFHLANPMGRAGSVWDIAQACAYLGSEASNFITGETLHLDGGSRHWGELWTCPQPDHFAHE